MLRRSSAARSVFDDLLDDGRATLSTTGAVVRDTVVPVVRDTVVPAVRDTVVPVGETLREQASELAQRSKPTRREAKRRAEAAVLALRGDLPARRRGRWATALLFLVAGTAAGAAAGLVIHRKQPELGAADVPVSPLPPTDRARVSSPAAAVAEQPDSVTLPDEAPLTD